MIFDQENIFYDNNLDDNNVIANVGGGDAHDPLFLAYAAKCFYPDSGKRNKHGICSHK